MGKKGERKKENEIRKKYNEIQISVSFPKSNRISRVK
jgi:hypothetical protein